MGEIVLQTHMGPNERLQPTTSGILVKRQKRSGSGTVRFRLTDRHSSISLPVGVVFLPGA
jgi:hypothetical protein